MRIVVVSKIRVVRDAISREIQALGYAGTVDCACFRSLLSAMLALPPPHLLFISAPPPDGMDLIREAREAYPTLNVGVLATNDDDDEFIAWAGVGISGYIEADTSAELVAKQPYSACRTNAAFGAPR